MEQFKGTIGEYLKQSIKTSKSTNSDCVDFSIGDKEIGFEAKGKFCKSGVLDVCFSIGEIFKQHIEADLSKKESCGTTDLEVIKIKYCFYMKGSCLWTKGYVRQLLHKEEWDEQIVCV